MAAYPPRRRLLKAFDLGLRARLACPYTNPYLVKAWNAGKKQAETSPQKISKPLARTLDSRIIRRGL